jgi:hypothetical protein
LFEVVAGLAAERLHIGFAEFEGEIQNGGHVADENSILARFFPAELVVEMQHG